MKLNELGKHELEKRNSGQWAKHAKLHSDLIEAHRREPLMLRVLQNKGP